MNPTPRPDALLAMIHSALEVERAQDRALNRDRALDRPAQVRAARPQESGTTILTLERPVRLSRGAEIVIAGAGGARAAVVRSADGSCAIEIDGIHRDVQQIMGRPLHLTERLGTAIGSAIENRAGLIATAAGWRPARLASGNVPADDLLEGLEADQQDALQRSLGSDFLLVLGPPGTGKTETLARTVAALLLAGERVLLLAPTHAAVDTALTRILSAASRWDVPSTALLRQGQHGPTWKGDSLSGAHRAGLDAALAGLEARADGLGHGRWGWTWDVAEIFGAEWSTNTRLSRLESRAQAVLREDGARIDAVSLLRDVRALERRSTAAGAPPRLVGATLAEALVRPPAGPWDTVVVDEAAMAHVPYALWAASLARRRMLLWGDPHQLGPVCPARDPGARAMLARSLFHHLGCDRAGVEDPRRPVLRVQHRMAPAIRRLVADAFYDGVLRDGAAVAARAGTVDVINTTGLARARASGSSRVNETHARMAAARAAQLRAQGARSIAVLTPYRAQVDCLRAALAERVPDLEREGGLIGTIHSAQGGEHDAVIVDLVCTRDDPGRFLDERSNPEAASLLCVAFSRARSSLAVIADMAALPYGGVAKRALTAARQAAAA